MESNYKIENKTLIVTMGGKSPNFNDAKLFIKEMFELCLMNSCNKILADQRLHESTFTDIELFEIGEYHAHIMPSILWMAIVCDQKYFNKLKLYENAAYNRGANIKIFTNLQTAQTWLNNPV